LNLLPQQHLLHGIGLACLLGLHASLKGLANTLRKADTLWRAAVLQQTSAKGHHGLAVNGCTLFWAEKLANASSIAAAKDLLE
jgi:hypothetical protein